MRIKKFLIFFLLGLFLATPLIGLAQFSQQQTYPGVGGQNLVGGSASQSIPSLVKYLFNLTVWICILAAVIVLIAGGVQYITATGDVSKMTSAKTRIYSSLLGLTILIGAYFVLHTMNPSLVIPKITYVPIKQGIVFFTKDGYDDFIKADDASIINDLVNANKAKFINYSAPDLTQPAAFGPLVFSSCQHMGSIKGGVPTITINPPFENNSDDSFLDFADFQPYTFAFWGKKAQGAKLSFYNKINYENLNDNTIPTVYDYRGLLDINGVPIPSTIDAPHNKVKDIIIVNPNAFGGTRRDIISIEHPFEDKIINDGSFKKVFYFNTSTAQYLNASKYFTISDPVAAEKIKSNVKLGESESIAFSQCGKDTGTYFNLITDQGFRNSAVASIPMAINHPPLSVRITWTSAGVYLVSADKDERYFDVSARDFKDPSISFDQKATSIKIINDTPERKYTDENGETHTTPPEYRDFLAILHQDDNFSGKLKVYFEQRMYDYSKNPFVKSSKVSDKATIPAYNICGSPISPTMLDGTKKLEQDIRVYYFGRRDTFTDASETTKRLFKVDLGNQPENLDLTKGKYVFWKDYNFGHLPMVSFDDNTGKVVLVGGSKSLDSENITTPLSADEVTYGVKEESRYGKLVSSPASIEVFELSQNPGGFGECQEVKICTEKGGLGDCLAYTSEQNKINEASIVYYPMPWYLSVPLPHEATPCTSDLLPSFKKPDGSSRPRVFENNIKSILIKPEGKCAVVLSSKDDEAKNSVFTDSDYNLDDNEIGQCGSFARFGGWLSWNCAKTIAVYPIK